MVNEDPFIIAEIGINHNGNLNKAIRLINAAKSSGVSAVKFQTYITEKRVNKKSPIFKILKNCELTYEDFVKIKNYCDENEIFFFSTPFDPESVNFLNKIKVKLFKIASFNISHYKLIDEIIKTKKPTIISTGMASLGEIKKISNKFKKNKVKFSLLHCISSYPNKEENSYLDNINYLRENFSCKVGLSDHTNDIKTSLYSYIMGAKIIEKHFKLSENDNCVDAKVSICPKKMRKLVDEIKSIKKIIGKVKFGVKDIERDIEQFKVKSFSSK
jgi:N,N'-diacetyllegionaminate synthase